MAETHLELASKELGGNDRCNQIANGTEEVVNWEIWMPAGLFLHPVSLSISTCYLMSPLLGSLQFPGSHLQIPLLFQPNFEGGKVKSKKNTNKKPKKERNLIGLFWATWTWTKYSVQGSEKLWLDELITAQPITVDKNIGWHEKNTHTKHLSRGRERIRFSVSLKEETNSWTHLPETDSFFLVPVIVCIT